MAEANSDLRRVWPANIDVIKEPSHVEFERGDDQESSDELIEMLGSGLNVNRLSMELEVLKVTVSHPDLNVNNWLMVRKWDTDVDEYGGFDRWEYADWWKKEAFAKRKNAKPDVGSWTDYCQRQGAPVATASKSKWKLDEEKATNNRVSSIIKRKLKKNIPDYGWHTCLLQGNKIELTLYFSREPEIITFIDDYARNPYLHTTVNYHLFNMIGKLKKRLDNRICVAALNNDAAAIAECDAAIAILARLRRAIRGHIDGDVSDEGNTPHLPPATDGFMVNTKLHMGLYRFENGKLSRMNGAAHSSIIKMFNYPVKLTLEDKYITYTATDTDVEKGVLPINAINLARTYVNHMTLHLTTKPTTNPSSGATKPSAVRRSPKQ